MVELVEASLGLKAMAAELPYNSQMSGLKCPYCNGGENNEYSLSVRRDYNQAFYQCHRVSCNEKGSININTSAVAQSPAMTSSNGYDKPLVALPTHIKEELSKRWFVQDRHIEIGKWKWAEEDNRIYMPIMSRIPNKELGWVLRSMQPVKSKTLTTLVDATTAALSFYANSASDTLIVVEDIPSAVRASLYVSSVAVLGTSITENKVSEMKQFGAGHVILALDKDATTKAAKAMPLFVSRFKKVSLLSHKMSKDLKDMPEDELVSLIKDG